MENTINTGAIKATIDHTTKTTEQPNPLVLALVFTTILCFGIKPSITNHTKAVSGSSQTTILSDSVTDAVVHDLSKRAGLTKSDLKIVDAQQLIFSDRCLSGNNSNALCAQSQVPGWQITVASKKKVWVYRTNNSGSMLKLDNGTGTLKQKNQGITFASNFASKGND